ncbi:MAG TPA: DUF4956 domain-containing protein [Bacteroidales bacterium]|nr:DUF4956 domain-containing protein [Bacteroidales bacterium]
MYEKMFDLSNPQFRDTMIMFVFNLFFQYILIRTIYYRYSRKETYLFAFFLIAVIVFLVGRVLNAVQIQTELAVGLVALFTILRFRTRSITMKDMSYMFAVIGISVINALQLVAFPMIGRVIVNLIIIVSAWMLEEFIVRHRCKSHIIIYENIDLLKPDRHKELLDDLSLLTGKKVCRVNVSEVDYKKKTAEIEIFYRD